MEDSITSDKQREKIRFIRNTFKKIIHFCAAKLHFIFYIRKELVKKITPPPSNTLIINNLTNRWFLKEENGYAGLEVA